MVADRGKPDKIVVDFETARCLRARSKWGQCAICVDACPGKAITQSSDTSLLEYSRDTCTGCGQCLSDCPFEAFTSPNFTESFLLNRLSGEQSLRMHCYRAADALEDPTLGGQAHDLEVCFAALSPGCLFELAYMRECVFDTDYCLDCPLFESERETIRINFDIARRLLASWGLKGFLKETAGVLFSDDEHPISDSSNSVVKLPTFKKSLSSIRARHNGIQAIRAGLGATALFRTIGRRAPVWRVRLAREWKRLEAMGQSSKELLLMQMEVDRDHCRACGTCMQFCATGAIGQTVEHDVFTYSYLPGLCVNCGLCIASCTNSAISRQYGADEAPFTRKEVFSKSVKYCTRCKSPFISDEESCTCLWCSGEPDSGELVEYSRSKMHFDEAVAKDIQQ